jgi:integrase
VLRALSLAGVTTVPRRSFVPPTPEWRQFLADIEDSKHLYRLSRLARYSSAHGVDPAQVDDDFIDRYRRDLHSRSLLDHPNQTVRKAILAWNHVRGALPERNLRELRVPNHRQEHTALLPTAFPLSFQQDVAAYLASLKGDDLFGERGARPASLDTLKTRRSQILVLASALVQAGRDPQSIRSLADLLVPEAAKAALRIVWQRLGKRETGHLHNLALLLVYLGRHWVKLAPHELDRLRELRSSLDPGPVGMSERNRKLLLQFADPANRAALLRLPGRLMDEAQRRDRGGEREARLAQRAVAIAILLLAAPLRIRTLVGLDRDKHIIRSRAGRRAVAHLVIPAEDVKNRVALHFALPLSIVELIDIYWERFRPRLVTGKPGPLLFPGRNGPMHRARFSQQISATVYKATGLRVHVHLLRALAGYLILKKRPHELKTVSDLLGHKSLQTTFAFYCAIDQVAASERYHEILSEYLAEDDRDAAD